MAVRRVNTARPVQPAVVERPERWYQVHISSTATAPMYQKKKKASILPDCEYRTDVGGYYNTCLT